MAHLPPDLRAARRARMTEVMRNVAVGLRKRLINLVVLVLAVLAFGELAVQLSVRHPAYKRLYVGGFVASSVAVSVALSKRK